MVGNRSFAIFTFIASIAGSFVTGCTESPAPLIDSLDELMNEKWTDEALEKLFQKGWVVQESVEGQCEDVIPTGVAYGGGIGTNKHLQNFANKGWVGKDIQFVSNPDYNSSLTNSSEGGYVMYNMLTKKEIYAMPSTVYIGYLTDIDAGFDIHNLDGKKSIILDYSWLNGDLSNQQGGDDLRCVNTEKKIYVGRTFAHPSENGFLTWFAVQFPEDPFNSRDPIKQGYGSPKYKSFNEGSFLNPKKTQEYDYIVIGAGNTGATLAARLAESDTSKTVLLLEWGKFSQDHGSKSLKNSISTPQMAWDNVFNEQVSHTLKTETNSDNKVLFKDANEGTLGGVPANIGKGLGGSTIINFNAMTIPKETWWNNLGISGWEWTDVEPYFTKVNDSVPSEVYGEHKYYPLVYDASIEMNIKSLSQGVEKEGLIQAKRALNPQTRKREDSYTQYLKDAMELPNLKVKKNTRVERIIIDDLTAVGVLAQTCSEKKGRCKKIAYTATREIVVSAGIFNTPALLQVSGIGNEKDLSKAYIKTLFNNPNVGQNLRTRGNLVIYYSPEKQFKKSNFAPENSGHPKKQYKNEFENYGSGPLTQGALDVYTVVKDRATGNDDYIMFFSDNIPTHYQTGAAFSIGCSNVRISDDGMGYVKVKSPAIQQSPEIDLNILGSATDYDSMLRCIKEVQAFGKTTTFKENNIKDITPYIDSKLVSKLDENQLKHYIQTNTIYSWHATGTAQMGTSSADGVVDNRLKVFGIEGLRVADASIYPQMIESGPMATCYMTGEKAAQLIIEDNANKAARFYPLTRLYNHGISHY